MRYWVGMLCKRISIVLVWVSLLFWSHVSASPVEKHILILNGFSPDFAAVEAFNSGLKREFQRHPEYNASFSYEYLDIARFNQDRDGYFEECARHFQVKYAKQRPDLIITEDTLTQFLAEYSQQVFPEVPIIALQLRENKDTSANINWVTGFGDDLEKNLELILRTKPAAKRILIIIGDSFLEREIVETFLPVASQYEDQVELVFTNKLAHEAMLAEVEESGEDTAVLFLSCLMDVAGERYTSAQVLKELYQVAKGPIYTANASLLGQGIVGGYLRNWNAVGEKAASVGNAILTGEEYSEEEPLLNTYAFDWRELQRWHIDESHLPTDSVIQYKEYSFWEQYKWWILLAGGAVFFETVLILGLLLNRSRRKAAEEKIKQMNAMLEKKIYERTVALQETVAELTHLKKVQEAANENLVQVNYELDFAAKTDQLTGIYNRRHILERIEEAFERFSKDGSAFSLVIADIDFFKKVNDEYGHDIGDKVLLMVAGMLKNSLRKYDVVARWGGEEFLLLLPDTTEIQAEQLLEGVRNQIAQTKLWDEERNIQVTMTFGVAAIHAGETVDTIMNYADIALYRGKKNGRNCVVVNKGTMKDF